MDKPFHRRKQLDSILTRALERAPEERSAFLSKACDNDEALRGAVESLLKEIEAIDSFLVPGGALRGALWEQFLLALAHEKTGEEELAVTNEATSRSSSPLPVNRHTAAGAIDEAPVRVGPYAIRKEAGRGGMGVVYEAEQEWPVHRRVALKLIRAGMDREEVIARFESERQALALMNHPNIASVYEAGATHFGLPYFAMEFVQGLPITEYCDRHRLTIRERLELFTEVCDGVQHAHQKGIIHRDLKPSNVLVAIQDEKPVPKIIDFGVAKAMEHRLTDTTVQTELGQLIGTPEYMSPEQADLKGPDIDTRTDVYSLGVLLYELLVGTQPFDTKSLRTAGFDEMRRKIREEEPAPPSSRLGTPASNETAWKRRVERAALEKQVRGDLDWITMRAIEKDRARRYGSPSDLAADIQRHLHHEPVLASTPSALYRARKFVRRHRWGVGAATAFFLATLIGITGLGIGLVRARRAEENARTEAAKAEAINEFLQEMLGSADPYDGEGREVTLLETLAGAVEKIDDSFGGQPAIKAAVQTTIGVAYRQLGRYEEAEPLLRSALELRKQSLGESHVDVAESLNNLGSLLQEKGDHGTAELVFREALAMRRRLLGDEHEDVAASVNNLALLLSRDKQDLEAAEPLFRESLALRRKLLGDEHPRVALALNNLAMLLRDKGDYEAAEPLLREALAMWRALDAEHPRVPLALNNLGHVLQNRGDYQAAEPLFREALRTWRKLLGDAHPNVAAALNNLASNLREQGDFEAAESLYLEAVAAYRESLGPGHWALAVTRSNYGACLTKMGRYREAEAELLAAHAVLRESLGEEHRRSQTAVSRLITLYEAQSESEKADEYRALLESTIQPTS